ncbi:MAG: DUF2634 domain-containing protein [Eubacterium sp.]|jgi:hypothetical protein|nr:DUF2634 domain-containing protein [Eubacterium sp.]
MLPESSNFLRNGYEIVEPSSYTFYLDIEKNICYGFTDNIDAMKQAIYLIIGTERYRYVIFSRNYGIELEDLFGLPTSYVVAEIPRRISEALLHDTRIERVENFSFKIGRGYVYVTFTAVTIFGKIPIEKAVKI